MFDIQADYSDCEPAGLELPKIEMDSNVLTEIGLGEDALAYDVLRELALKGVKKRGIDKLPNKQEYYDRAKYELEVLERLGFTDYILFNWDVVDDAIKKGVPIGDGRGSAAGSLLLYLLYVTKVDPIKKGLYFERFVSEARAEKITDIHGKEFLVGALAPDIDTDVAHTHRHLIVEYIEEKHKGRTSKILTFNKFKSKSCIKEAAKYFGEVDEEEANRISDLIPEEHGVELSLKVSYDNDENFRSWVDENREIYESALIIENLNKNVGVHPSGIAICSQDITNVIPLQLTKDGDLISGYDMDDVADLMVKFDILGLKTLSMVDLVCNKIDVSFDDIDPDNPFIYQVLQDLKYPVGLFQISARTNFEVVQKVKPLNWEELSDSVALARPAALPSVPEYVSRKHSLEKLGINDTLDEILATTKNVMLFQEQVMRCCNEVFGMPLGESELLRRAIGKKKPEEVAKYEEKIFTAARNLGIDESVAQYFWDIVKISAAYQFNLSHSICYASLAAKTVWLKFKYPREFFCSILELAEFEPKPLEVIAEVSRELKEFNIQLLPPRLDKSKINFTIEGNNIRYGLKSIKGVSEKTKDSLREFSKAEPSNKYEVFRIAKECGMNIGVLVSLIYAGALGEEKRLLTALEAQAFNILTPREKRNFAIIGEEFDYKLLNSIAEARARIGDDNKPIMKESRFETFKRNFAKYKDLYEENKKHESLATWWFEKKFLGYAYTCKLRDCFAGELDSLSEIGGSSWRSVGHIDEFFVRISQAGNRGMTFTVSDEESQVRLMFYDSQNQFKFSEWEDETGGIKKEDIVIVRGNNKWINSIDIVSAKVYTKMRDLK